ncbi:MAG: glycosyltransferase [Prochlorococcaceae cyanobacterium]
MTLDCIAEANRAIGRGDTIYALDLYELAASRMSDLEPLLAKYVKILRSRFVAEDADPVVDIIVPVFNAPQYARKCIESIASAWRSLPCRITVINDGSDEETSSMLRGMQANISMLRVIENKVNIGYTASVNVGLSLSSSKYVIVLNSDTIVSDGWIDRLVRCAESSPNIGVVGPLSNAASWQSVPDLYDTSGMFAVNELPKGMHVEEMARLVRVVSKRCYPLVPIVNGFCYLIKQEVIQCVGILDESNFPVGYGEENDFCIRTLESGYNIAVADDVYILHAKSKSFGAERKKELSKYGREALNRKHGEQKVLELVSQLKTNVILREMRELIGTYLKERRSVGLVMSRPHVSTSFGGISVLFVLPCKGHGGGIHSVIQEAIGLRNLGIHVRVAILDKHLRMYIANYASIDDIEKLLLPFNQENLHVKCSGFDVVIATIYNSVRMVRDIIDRNPHSLPAYYIQDYEPWFSPEGSTEYAEALESYDLIPGIVAFAKTDWLANIVNSRHGIKVRRVEASLDHTVYKPRTSDNSGGGPCVISAMIRPKNSSKRSRKNDAILATSISCPTGRCHD